ncbi:hypothetical protein TRFO_14328 [Tritrichomonas foetus]|uniref:Uncharacterized protein n=1 Tax=Tritrichomonas foetus TaxID=1144522 RepID=A0A1J4KVA0_9EUKA|nr:hypothetical protein TRFO_14328 [Tritrichomonas foetus]|eukprot:OHT15159.1 hypothetical protein TRFO_14328 [Tritrichomonas foetus]
MLNFVTVTVYFLQITQQQRQVGMSSPEKPMSSAQLKKKIQQLKFQNRRLQTSISEDQNSITNEESKAEQMAQAAREMNAAKEQVQQQINQKTEETKKILSQDEKEFQQAKERCMIELRQVKSETLRYTKMAEAAAHELFKLESQIDREYKLLKITEEQEAIELATSENELRNLERQEAHLLKLICQATPGVPPYDAHRKVDTTDLLQNFHATMRKRENQYQIEKQISQLQQLKQRLETDIKRLESASAVPGSLS